MFFFCKQKTACEIKECDWSSDVCSSDLLVTRLLANMGASGTTPLLSRFASQVAEGQKRWLDGFYLDVPEEMDDPYRFFCW